MGGLNLFGQKLGGEVIMDKVKAFWNSLPKTVKVFVYIFISYTLKFVAVELGVLEDSSLANYLVGLINLILVAIEEAVPAVKARLTK